MNNEEIQTIDEQSPEREVPTVAFLVAPEDSGARLDTYLAANVDDWSRARIQRLVEDGDILVNGSISKSSYKLRTGDAIEVELRPAEHSDFAPEDIPLEIVYEDAELIVVNKSAGLVVHPAAGSASGTLANALAFRFGLGNGGASGNHFSRPGIVHRLDKDTSGLIVVAKTEHASDDLSNQFRAREVLKSYVALVHGRVERESGRIDQPIARDPRNRVRMSIVRGGRPALTLYRVRRGYTRFTLLDVEIKTGRTHQIRVHFQWLKHPIVGDPVYGDGRDNTVPDPQLRAKIARLQRHFLHAAALSFRHPTTGEMLKFNAPLPEELASLLKELD